MKDFPPKSSRETANFLLQAMFVYFQPLRYLQRVVLILPGPKLAFGSAQSRVFSEDSLLNNTFFLLNRMCLCLKDITRDPEMLLCRIGELSSSCQLAMKRFLSVKRQIRFFFIIICLSFLHFSLTSAGSRIRFYFTFVALKLQSMNTILLIYFLFYYSAIVF